MSWYTFKIRAHDAQIASENLRRLVSDPLTREVIGDGKILRREFPDRSCHFFISPALVPTLQPFIKTYVGAPCEQPAAEPALQQLEISEEARWVQAAA